MNEDQKQYFTQLIEDNKDRIYRICNAYAVPPVEPKDLFQEVIFQILKSSSSFKNNAHVSTWIYKIAINVCYSAKLKYDKKNNITDRMESIQFITMDVPPNHLEREKFQALQSCISVLNESDKSIVILYLEDLAYKEIAIITGLTENHIAVKMKRIREKLFKCITSKLK